MFLPFREWHVSQVGKRENRLVGIGSLRQKAKRRKVTRSTPQDPGRNRARRTSLAQQHYRRPTNPAHPLQITSHPLSQIWSSTTTSPPSARSAPTTYVKLSDDRPFRRNHEEESGMAHGDAHPVATKHRRDVHKSTIADTLRTPACDRCPQHHVRRHLPPFRRQLQGRPAVSSDQGLQQRRGGLHPVCSDHHMRHYPQRRARRKSISGTNTCIKEILEGR
jgi:hypothetical protein